MKQKKLFIILCSCLGLIITLVILSFTAFALNNVTVNLKSGGGNYNEETNFDEIISSAQFSYHTPILFQNKNNYIANLEKSNPYLKVINIETVFPNKFIVHVIEREEVFSIACDSKFYIVDGELKVLRIMDYSTLPGQTYESNKTNPILLKGVVVKDPTKVVGDFLELINSGDVVTSISNSLFLNSRTVVEQKALYKQIEIKYDGLGKAFLCITSFDGLNMEIFKCDKKLANKFQVLFSAVTEVLESEYPTKKVQVLEKSDGEIFARITSNS